MNKRLLAILAPVAVGSVLLGATAYAAISGPSGYDLYKDALKKTHTVESVTPQTEISVKDNGTLLFKVESTAKINTQNKSMSNQVSIVSGDQQNTVDMYSQSDKIIIKSSDSNVYKLLEFGKESKHKALGGKGQHPGNVQGLENVIDALAGDLQNFITLKNNQDGTREVSLHLEEAQISPVINAVASLAMNQFDKEKQLRHHKDMGVMIDSGLRDKLPKLVSEIKVSKVDVEAQISKDNLIAKQSENLVITGRDAKGQKHEVIVQVETDFAGYNNTVPDFVDLSDKQVKVIEHKKPDNV